MHTRIPILTLFCYLAASFVAIYYMPSLDVQRRLPKHHMNSTCTFHVKCKRLVGSWGCLLLLIVGVATSLASSDLSPIPPLLSPRRFLLSFVIPVFAHALAPLQVLVPAPVSFLPSLVPGSPLDTTSLGRCRILHPKLLATCRRHFLSTEIMPRAQWHCLFILPFPLHPRSRSRLRCFSRCRPRPRLRSHLALIFSSPPSFLIPPRPRSDHRFRLRPLSLLPVTRT